MELESEIPQITAAPEKVVGCCAPPCSLDLRLADCMDVMKSFEDNHFDLAIVDPPYGIGAGGKGFINGASKTAAKYTRDLSWDDNTPCIEYFDELRRVAKHQVIWGANHMMDKICLGSPSWIVWDKTIHGNTYADCELAYSSHSSPARIFKCNMVNITTDGRIHPTQKPIKLYKWLLKNYAKPGDKILDTHMGSGSIAIACHYSGNPLVACEIDDDYYTAALERIERETRQLDFFSENALADAPR